MRKRHISNWNQKPQSLFVLSALLYTALYKKGRLKINSGVPFIPPLLEGKDLYMLTKFSRLHKPNLSLHSARAKLRLFLPTGGKQVTWLKKNQHRCYVQFNCQRVTKLSLTFLSWTLKDKTRGMGRLNILCLLFSWEASLILKEFEDGWTELNHADAKKCNFMIKRFKVMVAS